MADIKSMSLEEAQAYKQQLKDQGKTLSTSKEMGKVEDYIKTLQPENYGEETVQSAYEKLSRGVTERGGWTEDNLSELNARGIYPNLEPMGGGEDLTGYLNQYQEGVYNMAGSPDLRESIISQIEPEGMEQPEPINYVEQFEDYREAYGVADLEAQMSNLKASLRDQYAQRRQRTAAAEGEPVAMGVIAGRVTEIERQEAERIDTINREIAYINDQLTTAYNVIEMYMNFERMTYQDAADAYNTAFNQNLQIYKLVDEEMDQQQATARANLQTYVNAITSGNLFYDDLSSDQKAVIYKLEAQAGLPIGTVANMRLNPEDQILAFNSDKSQALVMDSKGNFITQPTNFTSNTGDGGDGDGDGGGGGDSETIATRSYQMKKAIKYANEDAKSMNISYEGAAEDGLWITPKQAEPLIQWWEENTGRSRDDWMSKFGKYVIDQS